MGKAGKSNSLGLLKEDQRVMKLLSEPIFMCFNISFTCISIVFLILKLIKCILNVIITIILKFKEHRTTE